MLVPPDDDAVLEASDDDDGDAAVLKDSSDEAIERSGLESLRSCEMVCRRRCSRSAAVSAWRMYTLKVCNATSTRSSRRRSSDGESESNIEAAINLVGGHDNEQAREREREREI